MEKLPAESRGLRAGFKSPGQSAWQSQRQGTIPLDASAGSRQERCVGERGQFWVPGETAFTLFLSTHGITDSLHQVVRTAANR